MGLLRIRLIVHAKVMKAHLESLLPLTPLTTASTHSWMISSPASVDMHKDVEEIK